MSDGALDARNGLRSFRVSAALVTELASARVGRAALRTLIQRRRSAACWLVHGVAIGHLWLPMASPRRVLRQQRRPKDYSSSRNRSGRRNCE